MRDKAHSLVSTGDVIADTNDSTKISYQIQGNLDLYEDIMLMKREKLKHHPDVINAIDRWWDNLIIPKFDLNKDTLLSKKEYFKFHRCLFLAIVEDADEKPLEEANDMAEADWGSDSKGGTHLTRDLFFDAIFELADQWT